MLNILGIITSILSRITDSFNRTDGSLGSADTGQAWSATRGTWTISTNKATSSDAGSTYPLAAVETGAQNVIVSADITDGGPGVAFWVTDANSWWASSVNYSSSTAQAYYTGSTVATGSTSSCSGGPVSGACSPGCGTTIAGTACSWSQTGSASGSPATVTNQCTGGSVSNVISSTPGSNIYTCPGGCYYSAFFDTCFSSFDDSGCGAPTVTQGSTTYTVYTGSSYSPATSTSCSQSTVTTTTYGCAGPGGNSTTGGGDCGTYVAGGGTTYLTELKLYKNVSGTISTVQTTEINSNSSAFVEANSIKASTSGDNITITAYQSSGLSSAFATTLTNTPTTPLKGTKAGIIKTPSSTNAGSLIDNFSAESV